MFDGTPRGQSPETWQQATHRMVALDAVLVFRELQPGESTIPAQ
jgi:hypothetical protein